MPRELDTRNWSLIRGDDVRAGALQDAAARITESLPDDQRIAVSAINAFSGTPAAITSSGGAMASADDPASFINMALEHVERSSEALGFGPATVPPEFVPDATVQATSAGSHIVHLHQQYRGVPVFQMARTVRFAPSGHIADTTGDNAVLPPNMELRPKLPVEAAVRLAAEHLASTVEDAAAEIDHWGQQLPYTEIDLSGFEPNVIVSFSMPSLPRVLDKGPFEEFIPSHLVIFDQGTSVRLSWHIILTLADYQDQYAVIITADRSDGGEVLYCKSTMRSIVGRGSVFEESPGRKPREAVDFPRPLSDYPVTGSLPSGHNFPHDWIDRDSTEGNSTIATLGDTTHKLQGQLDGGTVLFHPGDDTGDEQKILNIFYFCNYMHDFFYLLGFDEGAGNFQNINFTSNGASRDPVRARAHSGAVWGTANMLTPPDGKSPIMNMGLVVNSDRHTAMDADVVFHEFIHGVTNRLVGGRMNDSALDAPQSGGMGEGWSDYFALSIQNFGKDNEKVVCGDWVADRPEGIREFPYDGNFPDTFGDLGTGRYTRVHNIGEIWCATLMEMTRQMRAALESDERGYWLAWQIVVDGLKLTPANPSFLDARNSILRALNDLKVAGAVPEAEHELARAAAWRSFAKFGMGPGAASAGASLSGIQADFELPEDVQPLPTT